MTQSPGPSSSRADRGPVQAIEIPCVWYFLPLPHPLGLPRGWRAERVLSPAELLGATGPTSGLSSSLLIHQVELSAQPVLEGMAELWCCAASAMSEAELTSGADALDGFVEEIGLDMTPLVAVRTVAEVAVPGFTGEGEDEVLRALDLAIEHVRSVQRSVAIATQKAVRLIARATLPPTVPTFSGVLHSPIEVDEDPPTPSVRGPVDYFIPECAPPAALDIRPEPFDDQMLEQIVDSADRAARGAPFLTYADLRREAMVQRAFDGNNRMALVALAASGEVLLDTALLHMLWEEHVPPEAAARYFDHNQGHTARVRKNFSERIGGSWDPDAKTAAGRYLRELVRLRHQVVHAGHEPTAAEIDGAWSTMSELEKYLGDRLAAGPNLRKYTRTAMAWMGENGLRKRGRWTKHVQELVNDPSEPNWVDAFARWRHHVDRALDPTPAPPGRDVDQLMLYADRLDDGTVRWIIHDIATAHAAVVDGHTVRSAEEIRLTCDWLAEVTSPNLAERRMGSLLGVALPADAVWQPDHEVFPEFSIFAGGSQSHNTHR